MKMISTNRGDFNKFLSKYFDGTTQINVKITNRCPVECAHCRELSSKNSKKVISKETIDALFDKIRKYNNKKLLIVLTGGEALLYPEICEYIIEKCKNLNLKFTIYTSGWWYKEKEKYFEFFKKWNPLTVSLSINDWTVSKLGGIDYANIISEWFADKDNPILLTYSEAYIDKPKYYSKLLYKSICFSYKVALVGRASSIREEDKKNITNGYDSCVACGLWILTNGDVYANCPATIFGCPKLGDIYNNTINELFDKIKDIKKVGCNKRYLFAL